MVGQVYICLGCGAGLVDYTITDGAYCRNCKLNTHEPMEKAETD